MRLAIVGSTSFQAKDGLALAGALIHRTLSYLQPEIVISGGAIGVDTLAEVAANDEGIPFIKHPPKNQRWQPEGFRDRNILIAEDCTHLIAIRCRFSKTYGSGWTADRAEEMGRHVERFFL